MKKIAFLAFALVVAVVPAFADTVTIPFFRSGFAAGDQGLVTVANGDTANSAVVSVLYLSLVPEGGTQITTFLLSAGGSTGFDPIQTGAFEGPGSTIQNMTISGTAAGTGAGTVIFSSTAPLTARYLERNTVSGETAMYVGSK